MGPARVFSRWRCAAAAVGLLALASAGCATSSSTSGNGSQVGGVIVVAAASSLTEAFQTIATDFEALHPQVTVDLTFDSSSRIAAQIDEGAPIDLFASADEALVEPVVDLSPRPATAFAMSDLQIVTKSGNPLGIRSLSDLASVDVVALCAPKAPCGKYADEILAGSGVALSADHITRADSAKATLGAVTYGDADAGIVYSTDVLAAGDNATGVVIPKAHNHTAIYVIVQIVNTKNKMAAPSFMAYLSSPEAKATLRSFGFSTP